MSVTHTKNTRSYSIGDDDSPRSRKTAKSCRDLELRLSKWHFLSLEKTLFEMNACALFGSSWSVVAVAVAVAVVVAQVVVLQTRD